MKPSPIEPNQQNPVKPHGIAGLLASMFLNSKLTPLFIVARSWLGSFRCWQFRAKKIRRSRYPCSTS